MHTGLRRQKGNDPSPPRQEMPRPPLQPSARISRASNLRSVPSNLRSPLRRIFTTARDGQRGWILPVDVTIPGRPGSSASRRRAAPPGHMPPSPSTLARQLISWFSHNGGYLSSDIQLAHDDSHGFHVVAAGPLSSPVLVSCPLKLTLSVLNLEPDRHDIRSVDSPLQRCRGKIPNHILSYLLLLDQRRIGDASPWHAYISCLPPPESLTTPLWFDQEDCTFLAGTSAAPAAQERKQQLLRQWEDAVAVLKDLQIPVADDING